MKTKKVIAILAASSIAAATLLGGCGNSESSATAATTAAEAEDTTAEEADTTAAEETSTEDDMEDMAEITVMGMSLADLTGTQAVEDEINKITESEINTHVTIKWVNPGSYSEQVSLMMSSGEQMDLMMVTPINASSFSSLIAQNQLEPIDDLLNEYGTGILDTVGTYIKGTQVNGTTYAVPTYRTLNSDGYVVMRKDILDELGLTDKAENASSWTEIEEILTAVKEAHPELSAISNTDNDSTVLTEQCFLDGPDAFADDTTYDPLGDTYKIIASDSSTDTVYSYFESDAYYEMISRVKDWYDKGLVYKDAATTEETGDSLMMNNVAFSNVCQSEIGVEASKGNSTGYEVVCPKFCSIPVSTSSCTKFCWGIPVTAKEPEAAMKFLNMMYTNADICNLLCWGVEGTDYEVVDGVAKYLDGQDASSVAYHSADFLYGNQFLAYPWDGETADFRETAEQSLKDAGVSKYLGFTCDTTNIANELTAVFNVIQQYKGGLEAGSAPDFDKTYEEFKSALQTAGVQKVIDEYQSQLNTWLETNG